MLISKSLLCQINCFPLNLPVPSPSRAENHSGGSLIAPQSLRSLRGGPSSSLGLTIRPHCSAVPWTGKTEESLLLIIGQAIVHLTFAGTIIITKCNVFVKLLMVNTIAQSAPRPSKQASNQQQQQPPIGIGAKGRFQSRAAKGERKL